MHEERVDFIQVLQKDRPFKPINNHDEDLAELQGNAQTEENPVRALLYSFYLSKQTISIRVKNTYGPIAENIGQKNHKQQRPIHSPVAPNRELRICVIYCVQ